MHKPHDVVVVGASIAGCTAAILFARRGLTVALIERRSDPSAYKELCTHLIQASAVPTMERLGVIEAIEAAGGVPNEMEIWSRYGWVRERAAEKADQPSHGYNLRRKKLDPMLRGLAGATPKVDLMLGLSVRQLSVSNGRIAGVRVEGRDGRMKEIRGRLVVAADGRSSRVAQLARVPAEIRPNNRFIYYGYYRDLRLTSGVNSQMWFLEPDMAYAFPNDDDLTLLACIPSKEKLSAFKGDLERSFERFVEALPDGPNIREAERVSRLAGSIEYPNMRRPAARPGLALVGDAALVADYVWGVGIGWAFQSAEWLVEETADALLSGGKVDRALVRYQRRHRSRLRGHYWAISDFATARPLNPLERLFLAGATRDAATARHLLSFGSRSIGLTQFLSPIAIGRALRARLKARRHI